MKPTLAACLLTLLCLATASAVPIVEDSEARAAIVLPADPPQARADACAEMQRLIEASTGAKLPIAPEAPEGQVAVHVGPSDYVEGLGLDLEIDDDGFLIEFPDARNIVIIGPTDWGTEFGVYEFLERYIGVRWLLPGPDGVDVPQHETIDVPAEAVREEPAFFSRLFSGLRGGAQTTWARRNRVHGRVSFHHNLIQLFPPEEYTETHPEFFPLQNAERFLPPTNDTHRWQPCFTAPGIVDEAVANIIRYFDQNPEVQSYSLGVNDSSGHCQCENCVARDPGGKNFINYDHLSDRYFEWANAVVEQVLEVHPGKVFGCLAYSEIAQPPDRVKIHESIIPYMTYDRMKWVHADIRAAGEQATRDWHAMSPVVGWYDYIYGTPYCLPRVWFHHMADYYRFGHANGVRALYAEAYPNFGEGPKLYISLKLQWDPSQDVDALLDEWYERCVGPDAAADLKAYYAFWEDFWTRRILDSSWFTEGGQYLRFSTAEYLQDVAPGEIAECRRLLEAAVAKARTDPQKARAGLLLRAFEYYEASAVAYAAPDEAGGAIDDEAAALAVLGEGITRAEMGIKRRGIVEALSADPVLQHSLTLDRFPALSGDSWGATSLWTVFDWLDRSDAVKQRVQELTESDYSQAVRDQAQTMLLVADNAGENLCPDPSYEEGGKWSSWVKWATGTMRVVEDEVRTGARSMLCDGMKRGGPNQTLPAPPGRYAAVCFVKVPDGQDSQGTVEIAMTPRDADHNNLPSISTTITPVSGRWQAVATGGEIPEILSGKDVAEMLLVVIVNGFEPDEKVYIDDVSLYRLGDL